MHRVAVNALYRRSCSGQFRAHADELNSNLRTCLVSFQEFACNGTVVEHPEYGEVLQLQGDQVSATKKHFNK